MKKIITVLCVSICIITNSFAQQVVSTSFESKSLQVKNIPLNIYIPKDYDKKGKSYNLYIFLHGCCGLNHQTHISDFEEILNKLIAEKKIEPMIVVFPSAQGADFGNRHLWFNSERNGKYADLITVDLLDWIEKKYNISKNIKAIGGFSMGADGALRIALQYPDKFVATVSHSSFPALDYFLDLIPILTKGKGVSGYTYKPIPKSLTETVYGAASAWTPNINNPNYRVDFPLDKNGNLIDSVFQRMKFNADIDSIIKYKWHLTKKVPVAIYFDTGILENFYLPNHMLNDQLIELTTKKNYEINFKYNEFDGNHVLTKEKIESSILWLNSIFTNKN